MNPGVSKSLTRSGSACIRQPIGPNEAVCIVNLEAKCRSVDNLSNNTTLALVTIDRVS